MSTLDRAQIGSLGRSAGSAARLYTLLQRQPLLSIAQAAETLQMSPTAVGRAFGNLEQLGIAQEMTGKRRNRLFVYKTYLSILDEGTKPLPR